MTEVVIHRKGKGYMKTDFQNNTKWTKTKSLASTFTHDKATNFIQNSIQPRERSNYTIVSLIEGTTETIYENEIAFDDLEQAIEISSKIIGGFVEFKDNIDELKNKFSLMLAQCDLEREDLLHLIENFSRYKVSAIERNRIIKELERISIKRRQVKDQLELIKLARENNFNGLKTRRESLKKKRKYGIRTKVYERLGLTLKEK